MDERMADSLVSQIDGLANGVRALKSERNSLHNFKVYVHRRLDAMGVPADPKPAETVKTGCRIGSRLDWIEERVKAFQNGV